MGSHTQHTAQVGQAQMSESSYSQTFPVLQRCQFWSNYMSALKGPLCADEPTYSLPQPSIWTQYRPVDITLYDLIYGSPPPPSPDRLAYPYTYRPLHTDIYGTSKNRVARMW